MKNEEIAGLFAKKRNRYKGGIKSMTLIKAKKQRSKPQAPTNYKLRCTNDFVFKSLMTYDPKIGKRLVKDLTESIRDYVVDKVDLTSTELLTEGFQAKDIRLDICARLTPDRLIDFEMQCGSNKMEIPNRQRLLRRDACQPAGQQRPGVYCADAGGSAVSAGLRLSGEGRSAGESDTCLSVSGDPGS